MAKIRLACKAGESELLWLPGRYRSLY